MRSSSTGVASIDVWLTGVRAHVASQAPDLVSLLDPYIGEARFGRAYVDQELARLSPGAHVLEIGAGSMLLSCQLAREGYQVSALEPVGIGFSHFSRLRTLVLDHAKASGCAPVLLNQAAEQLTLVDCVDFAFSINVMEHVNDVGSTIHRIAQCLKIGARYKFTCPNYLFPYEPHFNIFTFFSKRLTEKFLARKIFDRPDIVDPAGTWKSLNWITVPKVAGIASKIPSVETRFNTGLLVSTVERMSTDPQFSARHSGWLRTSLLALMRFRIHLLLGLLPAALQPVMDCVLIKRPVRGASDGRGQ